jgi:hypothetical protein
MAPCTRHSVIASIDALAAPFDASPDVELQRKLGRSS